VDAVGSEAQPFAAARVEEAHFPRVERDPHRRQSVPGVGVVRLEHGVAGAGALSPVGEQDARFLEALAQGRHPVPETARRRAQEGARLGVGAAGREVPGVLGTVGRVDATPGEHVGPADEVGQDVALDQQHLEPAGPGPSPLVPVPHQDQRRRRPGNRRDAHPATGSDRHRLAVEATARGYP
jgi:hypothetical protein